MYKILIILLFSIQLISGRIIFINGKSTNNKIQFGKNVIMIPVKNLDSLKDTIARFPPILELIVQRIQNYFSNYVYQDMSRPGSAPNVGMEDTRIPGIKLNQIRRKYRV